MTLYDEACAAVAALNTATKIPQDRVAILKSIADSTVRVIEEYQKVVQSITEDQVRQGKENANLQSKLVQLEAGVASLEDQLNKTPDELQQLVKRNKDIASQNEEIAWKEKFRADEYARQLRQLGVEVTN